MQRYTIRLLSVAAALPWLLVPVAAGAGPARVDGLVGNPTNGRTQLFVTDELNQFLNPAEATAWSNRVVVSLGYDTLGTLAPFGGGSLRFGPATVGLYLNRTGNRFSDGAALGNVVGNMIQGGHGGDLAYTGGPTAPLYLPLDLLLGLDLGAVHLGFSGHASFGRASVLDEVRDPDDAFTIDEETMASNVVTFAGGAVIPGPVVSPEFWVRGGFGTAWHDVLIAPSGYPDDEPAVSFVEGIRDTGTISGGFRAPIEAGNVRFIPGVGFGYAQGQPYLTDYLDDPAAETAVTTVSSISGVGGLGVEYAPIDAFLLVGTASLEWDTLTIDWANGEEGDLFAGVITKNTALRGPIFSLGAEGKPKGPLVLRGAIRAGAIGSPTSLRVATSDSDGEQARTTTTTNLGAFALSASIGAGVEFDHVEITVSGGGFASALASTRPIAQARIWAEIAFNVPEIGSSSPVTPEPVGVGDER